MTTIWHLSADHWQRLLGGSRLELHSHRVSLALEVVQEGEAMTLLVEVSHDSEDAPSAASRRP